MAKNKEKKKETIVVSRIPRWLKDKATGNLTQDALRRLTKERTRTLNNVALQAALEAYREDKLSQEGFYEAYDKAWVKLAIEAKPNRFVLCSLKPKAAYRIPRYRIVEEEGNVFLSGTNGDGELDVVRIAENPLFEKARELNGGILECFFTVSRVDGLDHIEEAIDVWQNHFSEAEFEGFKAFGYGTNAGKACQVIWFPAHIIDKLHDWATNSPHHDWLISAAKYCAYTGLMQVATSRWPIEMKPERLRFKNGFSDIKVAVPHYIATIDNVVKAADDALAEVKRADGQALFDIPEWQLNEMVANMGTAQAELFISWYKDFQSCTIRAPLIKANLCRFNWHEYLHARGVHTFEDGTPIDYVWVIGDSSIFKGSIGGAGSAFSSWEEYCQNFTKNGHRFGTVLESLPNKMKHLPDQQMQVLDGRSQAVRYLADDRADWLNDHSRPELAAEYLSKAARKLQKVFPDFLNTGYAEDKIRMMHESYRNRALAGAIGDSAQYHFLQSDPLSFVDDYFGLSHIWQIPKYVILTGCGYHGRVVLSRNPCFSPMNFRIVTAINFDDLPVVKLEDGSDIDLKKIYVESPNYFVSSLDDVLSALDADVDGDEAFCSDNADIIELVEYSQRLYGSELVVWEGGKAPKVEITPEVLEDHFRNLTGGSKLGLYVYYLQIICSNRETVDDATMRFIFMWMRYVANVFVDASKHGGVELEMLPIVENALYGKTLDGTLYMKAPCKAIYVSKTLRGRMPRKCKKYREQKCAADMFASIIEQRVPETLVIDKVTDGEHFDHRKLFYDPQKKTHVIPGLCGFGYRGSEEGEWVKVIRTLDQEERDIKASSAKTATEIVERLRRQVFAHMEDWAREHNVANKDMFDYITAWTFSAHSGCAQCLKGNEGRFDANLAIDSYLKIYGGIAIRNAKKHLGIELEPEVEEDENEIVFVDEDNQPMFIDDGFVEDNDVEFTFISMFDGTPDFDEQ